MDGIDHMLNGAGSRRHHQDIIRQVQQDSFARAVEAAQAKHKTGSSLRAALTTIVNLLVK